MGSNRIKRPSNAQFRYYCFECADWVRDEERERAMMEVWGCVPEPQGRCDGRLVDLYRQACPLFRRRKDGQRSRSQASSELKSTRKETKMAKRVFISQPMRGKSEEEILSERRKAIEKVRAHYCDIDVIDSYIEGEPSTKNEALYKLGQSLQMIADADVAVFVKGWEDARGCRIENTAAIEYGVEVMEIYSD